MYHARLLVKHRKQENGKLFTEYFIDRTLTQHSHKPIVQHFSCHLLKLRRKVKDGINIKSK